MNQYNHMKAICVQKNNQITSYLLNDYQNELAKDLVFATLIAQMYLSMRMGLGLGQIQIQPLPQLIQRRILLYHFFVFLLIREEHFGAIILAFF